MPVSTHNASASRRFLPPSTKSPAAPKKFNTPSSVLSTNRFAKSTPVTSSAPSAKTLHVRSPVDEIGANLEDQSSSSPPLPSRLRFSSSVSRPQDTIYDDDDDDESRAASRVDGITYEDDDDLSDLLYLEKLRPTKLQYSPELERNANPTASLPRKRRRTSATDKVIEDVISMSSSPSPEHLHETHVSDDDDLPTALSHCNPPAGPGPHGEGVDAESTSSPSGPAHTMVSTRFRMPTPAVFHMPTPSVRPSFKLPQVQSATTQDQSMGSSLPNAFSPSRRRGKRDYIPGSAADTVRSWVLALAEQESHTAQTYAERFRALEIRNDDGDGRCVLVKDENGRRWLLINETARAGGRGSEATEKKVIAGSTIEIRSSITPNLQLVHSERTEASRSKVMNSKEDEWLVGIVWNVLI